MVVVQEGEGAGQGSEGRSKHRTKGMKGWRGHEEQCGCCALIYLVTST